MLGAVMFGHRHFQPVIDAIIRLAEKAAKEPRDFTPAGAMRRSRRRCARSSSRTCAPPTRSRKRRRATRRSTPSRKRARPLPPAGRREREVSAAAGRRRLQGARSQDRALEHPRHRHAHRRPRREDGAPDRVRGRRPAAHARLGAVHPRRDAGAGGGDARHRRGRAVSSTRWKAPTRRRFLLHYNFPPFSVGETGRMALARPARDRPRQARLARHPPDAAGARTSSPTRIRVVSEITEFERLVLDGDGLRLLARADGCRRAAEAAGRRHRHGPDPRGRALRRALRHPRRRGSSRRHGLQGRRHRERHHLAADGHQDRRHHRGDHAGRARPGARTAACTSSARWPRR